MIQGSCHCGAVRWRLEAPPESATACNCTACRRYGALWAYDFEGEGANVSGPTQTYTRGKWVIFHFCSECGCVAYWRSLHTSKDGRREMGVNLRLSDPETVTQIPIKHFDGLNTGKNLPADGRCISDYWS